VASSLNDLIEQENLIDLRLELARFEVIEDVLLRYFADIGLREDVENRVRAGARIPST
jgi:hypothetical protein